MCKIVKLLDFEKLNNEEKLKIMQIINQFHLPTYKIGCTNTVKHKIITKVINLIQYRHPQIHKEGQKQVTNLLGNDIIHPLIHLITHRYGLYQKSLILRVE